MPRCRFIAAALIAALPIAALSGAPSLAVTAKDKMATCKFGADDQKLKGKPRSAFMAKCMSNKNDPRGHGPGGAAPLPKS
jgi:hypothetical protein